MTEGRHAARRCGLLKRLGIDVHPGEGATTALLFTGFFLVITFQYVVKTVRQATFVDSLGAANLPWVYLLVALCSYPLLRIYVRLADRIPRHTLIAGSCVVVGLSLLGFWGLYAFDWPWVPAAFYVWVSIAFAITVTGCPAISIPCGFTAADHLPVGLQIVGPPRGETQVLTGALLMENLLDLGPITPIDPKVTH